MESHCCAPWPKAIYALMMALLIQIFEENTRIHGSGGCQGVHIHGEDTRDVLQVLVSILHPPMRQSAVFGKEFLVVPKNRAAIPTSGSAHLLHMQRSFPRFGSARFPSLPSCTMASAKNPGLSPGQTLWPIDSVGSERHAGSYNILMSTIPLLHEDTVLYIEPVHTVQNVTPACLFN